MLGTLKKGHVETNCECGNENVQRKYSVKLEGETSKWFNLKVEVHQSSVLCKLLFAIALDTLSDALTDDLVIMEIVIKWKKNILEGKNALESKGLKVNIKKQRQLDLEEDLQRK